MFIQKRSRIKSEKCSFYSLLHDIRSETKRQIKMGEIPDGKCVCVISCVCIDYVHLSLLTIFSMVDQPRIIDNTEFIGDDDVVGKLSKKEWAIQRQKYEYYSQRHNKRLQRRRELLDEIAKEDEDLEERTKLTKLFKLINVGPETPQQISLYRCIKEIASVSVDKNSDAEDTITLMLHFIDT